MDSEFFTHEKAKLRLDALKKVGEDFVSNFPIGSKVICWGDPTTKGITKPGRIYDNQSDDNVNVRYTLFEGKKPEKGMSGVLSPSSLEHDTQES